jgi:hypothetical protein
MGRLIDPEQFGAIIVKVGQSRRTPSSTGVMAPSQGGSGMPSSGVPDLSQLGGATGAGTTSGVTTNTRAQGSSAANIGATGGGTTGANLASKFSDKLPPPSSGKARRGGAASIRSDR